jgi:hypothetical protein
LHLPTNAIPKPLSRREGISMPDSNQRQAAESVFERNERREAEINQRRTEAR